MAAKKEGEREEVSSMFQRQRVDMLLRELTNRYPPKIIQQPAVPSIEQQKQAQPGNTFFFNLKDFSQLYHLQMMLKLNPESTSKLRNLIHLCRKVQRADG